MDSRDAGRDSGGEHAGRWRRLVVGLGNPGRRYRETRHNVGFALVDLLCAHLGGERWREFHASELAECRIPGGERSVTLLCLKPGSYMNRSGLAVLQAATEFSIAPEDTLVVHDDLDLPCGKLRLRSGGGSGGHRGVADVIRVYGNAFHRLRIGIDRPPAGVEAEQFVLRPFEPDEQVAIRSALERAGDACRVWAIEDIAAAMNRFNADVEE